MEAWKKFLDQTKVEDLLESDFKLITAKSTDTIFDVLKLLKEKHISSVPIFDTKKQTFLGMVDIFDLLSVLIFVNDLKSLIEIINKKEVDFYKYVENELTILKDESVESVINTSGRNPWCPVSRLKPLHSLMDMLSKDVNLHRVPIVDDFGNVIGLVTQSKVINFLYKNVDKYPATAAIKIKEFFKPTQVFSIGSEKLALDGYKLMVEKGVSGLAVVGSKGELEGSLSASDLKRSLEGNVIHDLYLPIPFYLDKATPEFEKTMVRQPLSCNTEMTIYEILHKLITNRVHRLFVVDGEQKPIGVLSLCDIISMMNIDKVSETLATKSDIAAAQ
jgi:CBS domain-containing protein